MCCVQTDLRKFGTDLHDVGGTKPRKRFVILGEKGLPIPILVMLPPTTALTPLQRLEWLKLPTTPLPTTSEEEVLNGLERLAENSLHSASKTRSFTFFCRWSSCELSDSDRDLYRWSEKMASFQSFSLVHHKERKKK